jgi:predicted AAA+ superfamily ATPase
MKRYLVEPIRLDLAEKMVFLGGPRQVGKTTLALGLIPGADESNPAYLSWDDPGSQRLLLKGGLPAEQPLIILDEIHKYKRWRNLVKGFYDRYKSRKEFLITGSARLDHYRRGGDSLQGRYHYYRLHPFSLYELNRKPQQSDLEALMQFGGFPEPFLKHNTRHWKRMAARAAKPCHSRRSHQPGARQGGLPVAAAGSAAARPGGICVIDRQPKTGFISSV